VQIRSESDRIRSDFGTKIYISDRISELYTVHGRLTSVREEIKKRSQRWRILKAFLRVILGRDYFAGLRVTKRNKATVLLTLTLLQTSTLTLTLILTLTLT
jgi:hypothetical protein